MKVWNVLQTIEGTQAAALQSMSLSCLSPTDRCKCCRQLWDWREAEVKLQLYQKTFSRDSWPSLQLSGSEDLVLHQVNNAVNVYETQSPSAGEHAASKA